VRDGARSLIGNDRRRRTDGARILVVEDSDDFRTLLELTLQDAGYVVDSAACSEDAIPLLAASPYDLVVTDYALPGHSGAWLLSQPPVRSSRPGMPALMITGDPDAPGIPQDVAVLPKPLDFDQLLSRVRSIIANASSADVEWPCGQDFGSGGSPMSLRTVHNLASRTLATASASFDQSI
jgi:DNA-binding response OmpR family regulator